MPHPRICTIKGYGLFALILSLTSFALPIRAQSPKAKGSADVASATKKKATPADSSAQQAAFDALKTKGLKRSGSSYVVSTETQVQRKLVIARNQLAQFRQAAAQQRAFEMGMRERKAFQEQVVQQRAYYNQQIAELNRQMPSVELARSNEAVNIARNQLIDQHNQLVSLVNEANDRIRLMNNQGDDSDLKQKVATEVAGYREAYMQTIVDVRELVDQIKKAYEELAKDPEITKTLQALNETSKVKYKLGPSREFLSSVAAFEKVEAAVLTETVELRKKGGVYWVDVTFNGKVTRPMVFDTGAGISTLSSSLAAEIGLRPKPSDPIIKCQTADGSIVEAKQMTVGSMRVGKFTVRDVVCAVMPPDKGDVDPLLGQSFHHHFTFQFTPASGRLQLSQVDEGDVKTRSTAPSRKGRGTSKAKRSNPTEVQGELNPSPSATP